LKIECSAGVRDLRFASPFAKPPGVGDPSPVINVLWGFANRLAGPFLLAHFPVAGDVNREFRAPNAGAQLLGLLMGVAGLCSGIA
jgi:hypothetical protein